MLPAGKASDAGRAGVDGVLSIKPTALSLTELTRVATVLNYFPVTFSVRRELS